MGRSRTLWSSAGSGTTIIAAEKTARRSHAMELDPRYVDVAVRRWEDFTGNEAIHAETGQTFSELCKSRLESSMEPESGLDTEGQEVSDGQ